MLAVATAGLVLWSPSGFLMLSVAPPLSALLFAQDDSKGPTDRFAQRVKKILGQARQVLRPGCASCGQRRSARLSVSVSNLSTPGRIRVDVNMVSVNVTLRSAAFASARYRRQFSRDPQVSWRSR